MLRSFRTYFIFSVLCLLLAAPVLSQTQPQTAKEFFARGVQLLRDQKFGAAISAFRSSIKLDPKQAGAHHNIGIALVALRQFYEAVGEFQEAVKLSPADAGMRFSLCSALNETNNFNDKTANS